MQYFAALKAQVFAVLKERVFAPHEQAFESAIFAPHAELPLVM